ncbi:MAG: hypothetical protein MI756_18590 [Chromatiales bacterium]|nr:hypothetical protein [Chromatiales bacterium]
MRPFKYLTLLAPLIFTDSIYAFEPAIELSTRDGNYVIETSGYAKVPLLKKSIDAKGQIFISGKISNKSTTSLVMWSVVDGKKYFTKLPDLQRIPSSSDKEFNIPFNSGEKMVSEVILEVEVFDGGVVELEDISLTSR